MKPYGHTSGSNHRAIKNNSRQPIRHLAFLLLAPTMLLAGCTGLRPPQAENIDLYLLDARTSIKATPVKRDLVMAVSAPRARPGFDTSQFAFVQQPHELGYFATHRWADTPSHMLGPLLAQALEQAGGFRAIVQAPGLVPADIRLDTELIRLQQDFETHPSRVQLTLRAQLIDVRGKRVLATKLFDETENAPSEDAYGGVIAANRALQRILDQLTEFCMREAVVPSPP